MLPTAAPLSADSDGLLTETGKTPVRGSPNLLGGVPVAQPRVLGVVLFIDGRLSYVRGVVHDEEYIRSGLQQCVLTTGYESKITLANSTGG